MILGLVKSLRPKQWTKNLLLFAGYIFTVEQHHPVSTLLTAFAAFGIFCIVSGSVYIFNDALDVERDRQHPAKRRRPIASGEVTIGVAVAFGTALTLLGCGAAFLINTPFGALTAGYFVLTLLYSLHLKHVVIVDLLVVTAGFVLRAVAGAVAIEVKVSNWLLVCTMLLALFLALAKRRGELLRFENEGQNHRKTLAEYSAPLLDQMLGIAASAALMSYFLYTFLPGSETGSKHPMMITVPFVIYGLFRYLYLIHQKGVGESPELVLLEDKPLLINVALYVIAAIVALLL